MHVHGVSTTRIRRLHHLDPWPNLHLTLKTVDQAKYYETLSNDELSDLALTPEQLSPEAKDYLASELSRRRITSRKVAEYKNDRSRTQNEEKGSTRERLKGLFPSLKGLWVTIEDWRRYRRWTGQWPFRSIGFSVLHLFVPLAATLFIVWHGIQHSWSRGRFLLIIPP